MLFVIARWALLAAAAGLVVLAGRRFFAPGAAIVGRCYRCQRGYRFSDPSQAKLARHYHETYDCPHPNAARS